MTREERLTYWQGIIDEYRSSGLSGAAFCREHNINAGRFYHWRRRLQENCLQEVRWTPMSRPFFAEIKVEDATTSRHRVVRAERSLSELRRGEDNPVQTSTPCITLLS